MIRQFKGNFPLTQGFGLNPDVYKQFGMNGHNGLDYGTPVGTPILASISGRVTEAVKSGDAGYGKYVKIENDKWGSLTAHFSSVQVEVGQEVSEGQQIGLSGNTGFSTGPHLHWGVFPIPRDRSNGYAGYIDQSSFITESGGDTLPVDKKIFEELVRKSSEYDKFVTEGFSSIAELKKKLASIVEVQSALEAETIKSKNLDDFMTKLAETLNCPKEQSEILKAINEDFAHFEKLQIIEKTLETVERKLSEAQTTIGALNGQVESSQIREKDLQEALREATGQIVALTELKEFYEKTDTKPLFTFKFLKFIVTVYGK